MTEADRGVSEAWAHRQAREGVLMQSLSSPN